MPSNCCHMLRHWFAAHLLSTGETITNLSSWLGHASPEFTLRSYGRLFTDCSQARQAIDALYAASCDNNRDEPNRAQNQASRDQPKSALTSE